MAVLVARVSALRIASRRYPAFRGSAISRATFATTPRWQIRTKEMTEQHFKDLKVNQARLMEDIHYTCKWGTGERWGESVIRKHTYFEVLIFVALLQKLECLA